MIFMKKLVPFLLTLCLSSLQAQETQYHLFLDYWKTWHVYDFDYSGGREVYQQGQFYYIFSSIDKLKTIDGKTYLSVGKSISFWDLLIEEDRDEHVAPSGNVTIYLLREEGQRVFFYDTAQAQEFLLYDFSLQVGDEVSLFNGRDRTSIFKVTELGTMEVNGETLKTLTLTDGTQTLQWIEGVGTMEAPLGLLEEPDEKGTRRQVDFVNSWLQQYYYLPFPFVNEKMRWTGQNLVAGAEDSNARQESLQFEIQGDSLHVWGLMYLNCGLTQYLYTMEEATAHPDTCRLYLRTMDMQPAFDCGSYFHVDFSIKLFSRAASYIVNINGDRDSHLVERQSDYRPFIEEGKVWVSHQGLPTMPYWGEYIRYDYFEGDTVVGGHPCKKWIQEYVSIKGGEFLSPEGDRVYRFVVSAYEEDRKVFFFFSGETQPRLWFDFGAAEGDTLFVSVPYAPFWESFGKDDDFGTSYLIHFQNNMIIKERKEIIMGGRTQHVITFTTTDWSLQDSEKQIMEGIGSTYSPDWVMSYPYGPVAWPYPNAQLACCYVGDEILYYDQDIVDAYRISLPASIRPVRKENPRQPAGKCFDLSGRRLTVPSVLPKGVYIEDGKKRVRK